jgi:hypothetical protein
MRHTTGAYIEEIKLSADGPPCVPERDGVLLPTPDSWDLFKHRMLDQMVGTHDFSWSVAEDGRTRLTFILTRIPYDLQRAASLREHVGAELSDTLDWEPANNSSAGG